MTTISLPHQFRWREHQRDPWNAFIESKKKHMLLVWHRRAGKTKLSVNLLCAAALQRVGTYFFIFPTRGQAFDNIWQGRGSDGVKFIDHFPKQLIQSTNSVDLSITFKNGSIIKLRGAALGSFEKRRGGNPVGFLYDEYAYIDPQARRSMDLVIKENNGWEIIISTPNGHNHFYDLYNIAKDDPEWFTQVLTVDNTKNEYGDPIFTPQMIEELEKEHGPDWIQQELYCSFEVSNVGAIFGEYMNTALETDRIKDFLIDPRLPVYTFWDLGWSDATCIWLAQFIPDINHIDEIRCVDYYEMNNQDVKHYVNWLNDWRNKYRVMFADHWIPHDGNHHNYDGKTYVDLGREAGINFKSLYAPVKDKEIAHTIAKAILPMVTFHKTNCARGIECLRNYRREYDEKKKTYKKAVHDWACHGSDAFMTMAQFLDGYRKPPVFNNSGRKSIMDTYAF